MPCHEPRRCRYSADRNGYSRRRRKPKPQTKAQLTQLALRLVHLFHPVYRFTLWLAALPYTGTTVAFHLQPDEAYVHSVLRQDENCLKRREEDGLGQTPAAAAGKTVGTAHAYVIAVTAPLTDRARATEDGEH